MESIEKMCFWTLKTSFEISMKIIIFFMRIMIKYGIVLAIEYFVNAAKGFVKVLFNPRHAIIALPLCLISPLDAKFFVGYTFGGAEYAPIIHLVIILAPFAYFYLLGKVDIVVVPEEHKIKMVKPSKPKKKKYEKQNKKKPEKTVNQVETLSSSGTVGFMKRVENIKTKENVKQ